MDRLVAAVRTQLAVDELQSLQVQNHLYGCFVVMEDIGEKRITLKDCIITGKNYTLNLDQQFSEIGIRYGFIMDTKLIFDSYLFEYKEAWLELFATIDGLEQVDHVEDILIALIKTTVTPEHAFFLHAMETGQLPQEWIHKAIGILLPHSADRHSADRHSVDRKIDVPKKPQRFHTTRRHSIVITKPLGKTRRAMKLHGLKM